jgi:hypothetical protein
MRWNNDDEIRFGLDLADYIDTIRGCEDAGQRIRALIEDQLLIAGVPCSDYRTGQALTGVLLRLNTKRVKRATKRFPLMGSFLFSMNIAAQVRALINAEDRR